MVQQWLCLSINISKTTVIRTLKDKAAVLVQVNPDMQALPLNPGSKVEVKQVCDESELDEK